MPMGSFFDPLAPSGGHFGSMLEAIAVLGSQLGAKMRRWPRSGSVSEPFWRPGPHPR